MDLLADLPFFGFPPSAAAATVATGTTTAGASDFSLATSEREEVEREDERRMCGGERGAEEGEETRWACSGWCSTVPEAGRRRVRNESEKCFRVSRSGERVLASRTRFFSADVGEPRDAEEAMVGERETGEVEPLASCFFPLPLSRVPPRLAPPRPWPRPLFCPLPPAAPPPLPAALGGLDGAARGAFSAPLPDTGNGLPLDGVVPVLGSRERVGSGFFFDTFFVGGTPPVAGVVVLAPSGWLSFVSCPPAPFNSSIERSVELSVSLLSTKLLTSCFPFVSFSSSSLEVRCNTAGDVFSSAFASPSFFPERTLEADKAKEDDDGLDDRFFFSSFSAFELDRLAAFFFSSFSSPIDAYEEAAEEPSMVAGTVVMDGARKTGREAVEEVVDIAGALVASAEVVSRDSSKTG